MSRKIKLIWDFRGPDGNRTAEHYVKHLNEFIAIENISLNITGYTVISDMHSIAYMVVMENQIKELRDILNPQRGEVYQD